MKCIKNKKTEEIIRVDDKTANQMVGNTWSYVPKKEWKTVSRVIEVELSEEEKQEKEQKLSAKATRRSKFKEKVI